MHSVHSAAQLTRPADIGSKTIPIVKVFVVLLWIIAKPISIILDKVLGDEIGTIHSHSEVRAVGLS